MRIHGAEAGCGARLHQLSSLGLGGVFLGRGRIALQQNRRTKDDRSKPKSPRTPLGVMGSPMRAAEFCACPTF